MNKEPQHDAGAGVQTAKFRCLPGPGSLLEGRGLLFGGLENIGDRAQKVLDPFRQVGLLVSLEEHPPAFYDLLSFGQGQTVAFNASREMGGS